MPETTLLFSDRTSHIVSACAASVRRTFTQHVPLYVCTAVFCIVSFAIAAIYRVSLPLETGVTYLLMPLPIFLTLGIIGVVCKLVWFFCTRPVGCFVETLRGWLNRLIFEGDLPGNAFHAVMTVAPLMIGFIAMKNVLPQINPFSWDETFMQWDSFLWGGRQPWEMMQPLLGYPPVTAAINIIYECWFMVMFGCLFWQALSKRSSLLRTQFLLAFCLAWFLAGNVLAVVFSSAGPCFYTHFHPNADPYAALMTYLRAADAHWPVWSIEIQDMLWKAYATGSGGAITGISAMPSLHVAIAALVMFLGWRTNPWLGTALTAFAIVVAVGAVHLAWHYAVDSLAGLALGAIFWFAAGWIVRAHQHLAASRHWSSKAATQASLPAV